MVSVPSAMPHSIWPVAILAPSSSAPARLVPQACIMVMAGVVGASALPITASRARFQSLAWVTTAPPTTSSIWAPCKREAIDQAAERRRQHVEIGELGIGGVRAAKGNARSRPAPQHAASNAPP